MELGERIKENRELKSMSQDDLANYLKVSRQSVSKWESSKNYPSLDILVVMSDFFNVSLDDFIKGDVQLKKTIIKGEYQMYEEWESKGRTMGDFLATHWWTAFPVVAFILFLIKAFWG